MFDKLTKVALVIICVDLFPVAVDVACTNGGVGEAPPGEEARGSSRATQTRPFGHRHPLGGAVLTCLMIVPHGMAKTHQGTRIRSLPLSAPLL